MQRCPQCKSLNNDEARYCHNCGQQLIFPDRTALYAEAAKETPAAPIHGEPRTIAELQQWYRDRNLPAPEVTRFFIGVNYTKPKAFGIYQEGSSFVVYKNKADGSRSIRYQGPDEAYAVKELYQKLKEEIAARKGTASGSRSANASRSAAKKGLLIFLIVTLALCMISYITSIFTAKNGYYRYGGETYYHQGGDWYGYDNDWYYVTPPDELTDHYRDYYSSNSWNSTYDTSPFDESDYYESSSSSSSDSDWDSSDSWDSGGTDWDSDW